MPTPERLPPAETISALSHSGLTYSDIATRYGVKTSAVHARMRRAGLRSARTPPSAAERFWEKVNKNGPKGCWLWTASANPYGYGQFMVTTGKLVRAHRYAWELLRGPIPPDMTIDHLCRVTLCVNPAHLEVTTMAVNVLRNSGPSAIHAQQTHCVNGHEFTTANTYAHRGRRMCRSCMAARKKTAAYRERDNARRRARYAARDTPNAQ